MLMLGAGCAWACGSSSNTTHKSPTQDAGNDAADAGAPDGATDGGTDAPIEAGGLDADPTTFMQVQHSCAYHCDPNCSEATQPYDCQNLRNWQTGVPHAAACPKWNGKYPAVVQGKCTVTDASGDAAKFTGPDPDDATITVLPDGRRIQPAGKDWVFSEQDLQGGITTGILNVPSTPYVLTVDTGTDDHAVRAIDTTKIGAGDPVTSYVKFADPETLNSGMAFVAPGTVYVATDDGVVQALDLDTSTGQLQRDDAHSLPLPASTTSSQYWYVSGVAASPDGKLLAVSSVTEKNLLVFDVAQGSATFGQQLGEVDLGGAETFGVYFDPLDSTHAYLSMWSANKVIEVDLTDPTAPSVVTSFKTDKDPEGIAFLDARWMIVGNDLGDTLSLIDRVGGTSTSVPVDVNTNLHGLEPSALDYDRTNHRLYVALSGINALGVYDVDLTPTPPTITPDGRLPTAWWPSGVAVRADGSVAVSSMRAHGTGPNPVAYPIGSGGITDIIRGGVQFIPTPTPSDLSAGETTVQKFNAVDQLSGRPTVTCPSGVMDFPVPPTNTQGPSPDIQHVFFVVRENKDFDGVLGDLKGVNGDPSLTLKAKSSDMDEIWHNFRTLARTFTTSDNYYTAAVQSTQGHVWTTYGRTNDFNERTWAISGGGRDARTIPGGGVLPVGEPEEGSLFVWAGAQGIPYDILGEIVGQPSASQTPARNPIDIDYPGGPFQNIGYNDLEKACYVAGRVRVLCNIGNLTYMTLPNDHTFGVSPTNPTPETFCAVNDEATGMLVDAVSHSPIWKESLIIITEDDPQQGGEHVDNHRTPIVMVSPWIKRGYVSHEHIDISSIHKLFAHIFGKPYLNYEIANAALPLDMFTSTPDYTPYTYAPRTWPLACGGAASRAERELTASWDFSMPDQQPGLGAQVVRWMRGRQLKKLPPALAAEVDIRIREKKLGLIRRTHDGDD
jgi:hypothetical protein